MSNPHQSAFSKQYKNSSHLDTRIGFHERFSANKYPWHRWVFDHFDFPKNARVLELGCGPGKLWSENAERIGAEWEITLSDFSEGMLASTQHNLAALDRNFRFQHFGAEQIPHEDKSFDVVIANHMLYHTDVNHALSEIRRVLKPDGKLCATSNGKGHLKQIDDLIVKFRGGKPPIYTVYKNFSLDKSRALLSLHFSEIQVDRQENSLKVDDPLALAEFCFSLSHSDIPVSNRAAFRKFVRRQFDSQSGVLQIGKNSGLIEAIHRL
jgi:ubiquinone/menaquinone biosynthesis C-methylase UbiE